LATFGKINEEDISTDRPAKYSVHNFLPAKGQSKVHPARYRKDENLPGRGMMKPCQVQES
jgi:hypothetical protein